MFFPCNVSSIRICIFFLWHLIVCDTLRIDEFRAIVKVCSRRRYLFELPGWLGGHGGNFPNSGLDILWIVTHTTLVCLHVLISDWILTLLKHEITVGLIHWLVSCTLVESQCFSVDSTEVFGAGSVFALDEADGGSVGCFPASSFLVVGACVVYVDRNVAYLFVHPLLCQLPLWLRIFSLKVRDHSTRTPNPIVLIFPYFDFLLQTWTANNMITEE